MLAPTKKGRLAELMSAMGQKRTFAVHQPMSALPPKADMCGATRDVRFGPIADIESSILGQQPGSACYKGNSCNSRDKPTKRHHLFDQYQCRKGGDPKEIHDASDKQERHQSPAAADAVKTMAKAKRQGASRLAAKPKTKDESDRRFAVRQTRVLKPCPLVQARDDQDNGSKDITHALHHWGQQRRALQHPLSGCRG